MVQVVSTREEDGHVLLNVCILHHNDHHKYGDIRITSSHGGPSIRYIIQQHNTREREGGFRISLSSAEIGDHTGYLCPGFPVGRETSPYLGNVSGTHRKPVGSISQSAETITVLQIATYPSGDLPYGYVFFTGQTQ